MKRWTVFVTLAVSLALLAACAAQPATPAPAEQPTTAMPSTESAPTEAPAPTEAMPEQKPFKAGLLAPGPVNDGGWNQTAYEALKRMESELGAEISYVELEQSPAAFEKAFRDFASQGYQYILGHGFEFQDAAITVAKDYPDTYFFISSSRYFDPNEPNVIGLNSDSSQPCYVFGYIAAKMGKGAGLVGGMEIPPITEAFDGFKRGAQSVNPDFSIKETLLGNWTDVAAAKEAALGMAAEGADILVPNADLASNGVFQAMAEQNINGFSMFGDNTSKAPKNILVNYILDYGQGLVNVARMVKEGTFKPTSNIEFGFKDTDVIYLVYNEEATTPVPADLRQEVDDLIQKISAGEIVTLTPVQ